MSGGIIMPHKEKWPLECKLAICNAILHGSQTVYSAARQYHITCRTIGDWLLTYQSDGAYGLVPSRHCKSYSPELKWSAVQDYLSGKGTEEQICTKYGIKSISRLRAWIKRDVLKKMQELERRDAMAIRAKHVNTKR